METFELERKKLTLTYVKEMKVVNNIVGTRTAWNRSARRSFRGAEIDARQRS